uniref:hypothetical protein n=1 Tax=Salmonella sp. TaxID=599 RepID=UPI001CD93D33|nr:hypothetical protein [Salmonella sp.]
MQSGNTSINRSNISSSFCVGVFMSGFANGKSRYGLSKLWFNKAAAGEKLVLNIG